MHAQAVSIQEQKITGQFFSDVLYKLVGQLLSVISSYKSDIRLRGSCFTGYTLVASVFIDHLGYDLVPYKNEDTRV